LGAFLRVRQSAPLPGPGRNSYARPHQYDPNKTGPQKHEEADERPSAHPGRDDRVSPGRALAYPFQMSCRHRLSPLLFFANMWKNHFQVKFNCIHLGYDKIFRTMRTVYEKAAMTTTITSHEPGPVDVFDEAAQSMSDGAEDVFPVRSRGRPKTEHDEAQKREARRVLFGSKLRRFREGRGLTLAEAAQRAGISSPRKLSQYETTCYPPGWVIRAIAPVYGVREAFLAELVLKHNDPDLHHALMSDIDEGEIQNA